MALNAHERETVVNFSDGDQTAYIYTAQRRMLTRLARNPAAKLVESGEHDGTQWARYELPSRLVSVRQPRAKRELSDEQRAEIAARLRNSREG